MSLKIQSNSHSFLDISMTFPAPPSFPSITVSRALLLVLNTSSEPFSSGHRMCSMFLRQAILFFSGNGSFTTSFGCLSRSSMS